jgi:hypothetical protein
MRARILLVGALGVLPGGEPAPEPGPVPGLHVVSEEPLGPGAVPGVIHPGETLFRIDASGWPIVGDSGFVALRDHGAGFVYWTRQLDRWRGGEASPDAGRENWGQIETFACLAGALREFRERLPDAAPVPIGHISGEFGGFPGLHGAGYSGHVSHQTGLHVNLALMLLAGVRERVEALPGEPDRWDRGAMLVLLDVVRRHAGRQLVTNREVVDLDAAHTPRTPSLDAFSTAGVPARGGPVTGTVYSDPTGALLVLFDEPGNHADHCNVAFWPGEP